MDFIKDLVKEHAGEFVQTLTSKVGLGEGEANRLLGGIVEKMTTLIKGGDLDLGDLLGGDGPKELLSKLNPGELASAAGIDEAKAKQGIDAVVPSIVSKMKEEGGDKLTEMLGGGEGLLGAAGKLASGFLKR